jgi:hypothetical protein
MLKCAKAPKTVFASLALHAILSRDTSRAHQLERVVALFFYEQWDRWRGFRDDQRT